MIDKIKKLREEARFSAEITRGELGEVHAYYNEALTRILTEGYDWVDTRDKLPKAFGQYIAQIKGAKVPTALYYNPGTKEWSDQAGNTYKVTGWQPFPPRYERSKV